MNLLNESSRKERAKERATVCKADLMATFAETEPVLEELFLVSETEKKGGKEQKSSLLLTATQIRSLTQNLCIEGYVQDEKIEFSKNFHWKRSILSKTRAETVVFRTAPAPNQDRPANSKKIPALEVQVSYTINSRNELIVKHAYHSSEDISLAVTHPLTFACPPHNDGTVREKIAQQNFFGKTLSATQILTDTPELFSGLSYPEVLHQQNLTPAALSSSLGIELHEVVATVLAPPHSPHLKVFSNALYTHWTLGSTEKFTYLQLDPHSFTSHLSQRQVLQANKRYEYTVLYQFS